MIQLVLRCLLVAKKEILTGILTDLTGWSKSLDQTGRSTRPVSISASKTHFEVLSLGLEAYKSSKIPCPWPEDSIVF